MKVNTSPLPTAAPMASALRDLIRDSKLIADKSKPGVSKFKEYVSNSYLTMLEHQLMGTQGFFGNETFLKFGNELHKRLLEPKEKKCKLSAEEEALLKRMLASLHNYAPLMRTMQGAKFEQVDVVVVYNQPVKVVLDIQKGRHGADIKTTSCTSESAFTTSMKKYKYFTQAWLYIEAKKLKSFDFVACCKKKDLVFTVPAMDFKFDMQEGEDRAKRLIDAYKGLRKFYQF